MQLAGYLAPVSEPWPSYQKKVRLVLAMPSQFALQTVPPLTDFGSFQGPSCGHCVSLWTAIVTLLCCTAVSYLLGRYGAAKSAVGGTEGFQEPGAGNDGQEVPQEPMQEMPDLEPEHGNEFGKLVIDKPHDHRLFCTHNFRKAESVVHLHECCRLKAATGIPSKHRICFTCLKDVIKKS